ncbi:MAG: hypothetical protein KBC06_02325 [Candidatus Pacebacteria bacterium]|nr:hypothetical protein [Candidatus Paceibacterota bacterium]
MQTFKHLLIIFVVVALAGAIFRYEKRNNAKPLVDTPAPIVNTPTPDFYPTTPLPTNPTKPTPTQLSPVDGGDSIACTMEAKLCADGSYVGRSGPRCEFTACPDIPAGRMSFGVSYTLKIDQPIMFADGLAVTVKKIDDSRCKPGVQCIWAGELAPTLSIWGGDLGKSVVEVVLGTTRNTSVTHGRYVFTLNDATATTASLTVVKQ